MAELEVLIVGQLHESLSALGFADSVRVADLKDAAEELTALERAPQLIVLAESRPGEFSETLIEALRRLAPLARIHRLLGTWCEGHQRSGQPPAGCTHSYWHQWQPRIERQLARAEGGVRLAWALPVTAGADERISNDTDEPLARGSGLIVICASMADAASSLADACQLAGYTTSIVREDQAWAAVGASAIVWDTTVERVVDGRLVQTLRHSAGGAPLVAVVGFPRADDVRRAMEVGVAAVVSKPFLIHDLAWQLAGAIAPPRR